MRGGREAIIISELPYQVNKASLIEKISELMKEKRVEGISEVRDESNREASGSCSSWRAGKSRRSS